MVLREADINTFKNSSAFLLAVIKRRQNLQTSVLIFSRVLLGRGFVSYGEPLWTILTLENWLERS